eukprot:gene12835-13644_t
MEAPDPVLDHATPNRALSPGGPRDVIQGQIEADLRAKLQAKLAAAAWRLLSETK